MGHHPPRQLAGAMRVERPARRAGARPPPPYDLQESTRARTCHALRCPVRDPLRHRRSASSPNRRILAALVPVAALGLSLVPAAPAAAKKDTPRPIVSGWLPYWTTNASIASMTANKDLLQEVSPFWYTVRPNATGTQAVIGTQSRPRARRR